MKPKRQRNACVYTGLVGAKMRIPVHRKPTRIIRRVSVRLRGGPLSETWVRMDNDADLVTLPFTLRGETGRYVHGAWEPMA